VFFGDLCIGPAAGPVELDHHHVVPLRGFVQVYLYTRFSKLLSVVSRPSPHKPMEDSASSTASGVRASKGWVLTDMAHCLAAPP